MAQRPGAKKEIDPEELMRRKFRAKCLFRALGRLCMANTFWLIDDIDEYEGVEDVKRRVEQAVRGKVKKQLLNVKDKALLNKPVEERTEHEKKYLYRIIGGLKCFKRYPNHVKRRLAAATYFQYYGPNRVVVREHQEAHALYFIVSGTVVVTQLIYDELLEEYVSTEICEMAAGDMFGEVSLLHNIPRTATVMTTDHCEFLQLLKEDFKRVLQTCVQKQWDEVKQAMKSFTYFDALDEVAFREGCIVAKMKEFKENETILGDGVGVPNHVYFILYGRVQIIESLKIYVVKRLGKTFFTLFDPYVPPEPSEQDFEKKWFAAYNLKESEESNASNEDSGDQNASRSRTSGTQTRTQSILKQTRSSLLRRQTKTSVIEEDGDGVASSKTVLNKENEENATGSKAELKKDDVGNASSKTELKNDVVTIDQAVGPDEPLNPKRTSFPNEVGMPETALTEISRHAAQSEQTVQGSRLILVPSKEEGRPSVRYSIMSPEEELRAKLHGGRLKTFFMQIPNKQKLFEEFTKQQEWEEYRMQVVEDVVARTHAVNNTSVHDVPYSIRLEEMFGI